MTGRTSSVVIKHSQKSDCWPSVLSELCCVFLFWTWAFMLEVLKSDYLNVRFLRWLWGLVAFTLDFCVVLFSTKTRPIPRELSSECTRRYQSRQVVLLIRLSRSCFFWLYLQVFLHLALKFSSTKSQKRSNLDNLSLISKAGRCRFVAKAFCPRRCMHTVAICLNNLTSPFLKSPLMKSHCRV